MTSLNKIEDGIWKKLFQFPKVESKAELNKHDLLSNKKINKLINLSNGEIKLFNSKPLIHKLSHKIIHAKFWIFLNQNPTVNSINFSEIKKYPVPKLIQNFLDDFNYKTFLKTFSYK
jgi:A/G-specific adenine glycosylase